MALQKNIKLTDNFGIEVEIPNAYIKVEISELSKNKMTISKLVKKSKDENIIFKNNITTDYNIDKENPIKQAYLHLKTLSEFSDAVDC